MLRRLPRSVLSDWMGYCRPTGSIMEWVTGDRQHKWCYLLPEVGFVFSVDGAILTLCRSMSFYATDHQCREVISAKETVTIGVSGVVVTSTLATPITVYADGIPLIWEESDLPKTTSASTTPLSTQTSTATGGTASSSPNKNTNGGLSEGAKIGIGIGIPVAAIAIGVAIFFHFLSRHKTAKEEPLAELYDASRDRRPLTELATKENSKPFELASRADRPELPSNTTTHVHELA